MRKKLLLLAAVLPAAFFMSALLARHMARAGGHELTLTCQPASQVIPALQRAGLALVARGATDGGDLMVLFADQARSRFVAGIWLPTRGQICAWGGRDLRFWRWRDPGGEGGA